MKPFLLAALAASLVFVPTAQASHTWGTLGFYSEDANTDLNAQCWEATFLSAAAINQLYGAGSVNGGTKANCPGPHPNATAKWQQWINASGTRIFDCLYDEDPGLIEVTCRRFDPLRPAVGHTGWEWDLGTLQITPNGVDGTVSCGEANFEVAGFIAQNWGQAAITGAWSGNCAGPHPSPSSKYVQWGGPNGSVMYDCLYDEDPPTIIEFTCAGSSAARIPLAR